MNSVQLSGAAIAKRLASCNTTARNRAVRLLSKWLPEQQSISAVHSPLTDSDLIKIWKGLFYCVWHADKLPFQLDLTNRLSSLLQTLDSDLALSFFESFLITIRREWSGIDFLRLDKFYLLIRKFVNSLFAFLKNNSWNIDLINRTVAILTEKCLLANDKFQAGGVNYHIAEVFLDEIAGFLLVEKDKFELLLTPFVAVLEKSMDRVLVGKVKANVFERLCAEGERYLEGEKGELGKYGLVLGFSEKFFETASGEKTVQGNRKVLFALRDRFLKLEKEFEKSGVEVSFELGDGVSMVEEMGKLAMETSEKVEEMIVKETSKKRKGKEITDGVEEKGNAKKKKKKKKKGKKDVAVANDENDIVSNGAASEENVMEINDGETKGESKKKKKSKRNKDLSKSASVSELDVECNGEVGEENGDGDDNDVESNGDVGDTSVEDNGDAGEMSNSNAMMIFNESVISNLQKQFEKAAAEDGLALPETKAKKRKRAKSAEKAMDTTSNGDSTPGKSGENAEKSAKKVRFSMKNNLVWKPQTPMPPQSLRCPPSATPRGSALKKGLTPGPIKQSPATVRKIKAKGSSAKKGRKILKTISPATKRIRKLQSLSS